MKKILVIGSCGAGKSTLAKKVSEKFDLSLIGLDQYYYKKDWVCTPKK
jgi:adenylate kinase family enzyme